MSGLGTWADGILQPPCFQPACCGERREERGESGDGRGERGERREERGERMEQWMEKGMEEAREDRMDCLHKLP